ncbi:hypothetical protein LWS67_02315 [Bacillus atrophaeus]|uniref:hypothetical protein n=1 Tax=Bacillus atrophaeus TaxID=1452 RepID=UPI001EFBD075|nr:hypothetical protein [Bacillus atrophaeus]MCG8395479.1 hypothetical protein [Bacillus atrophaeus]
MGARLKAERVALSAFFHISYQQDENTNDNYYQKEIKIIIIEIIFCRAIIVKDI